MPRLTREQLDEMTSDERTKHAQEVVEEAGCRVFDWAYPIDWWKDFRDTTGFNNCCGEIVWGYGDSGIFGKPVALTHRAQEALDRVPA